VWISTEEKLKGGGRFQEKRQRKSMNPRQKEVIVYLREEEQMKSVFQYQK
jgi:hypothetical protein